MKVKMLIDFYHRDKSSEIDFSESVDTGSGGYASNSWKL